MVSYWAMGAKAEAEVEAEVEVVSLQYGEYAVSYPEDEFAWTPRVGTGRPGFIPEECDGRRGSLNTESKEVELRGSGIES